MTKINPFRDFTPSYILIFYLWMSAGATLEKLQWELCQLDTAGAGPISCLSKEAAISCGRDP